MDFTFDADQEALRQVAHQVMSAEIDGVVLRRIADDPFSHAEGLWDRVVELGWPGLLVPEEHGGAGAGLVEACIVMEEMGRVAAPGPFFSSGVLATLAARELGASDLLEALGSGAVRGTVALQELGYGDPVGSIHTRARRRGSGWVLDGLKPVVLDGHAADFAIVAASTEEGLRSFLVDRPEGELVATMDPTRKVARLELAGRPALPLGPSGNQRGTWHRIMDDAGVALCAETVGVSARALELATEYAKQRVVFDRPVASFQVAKHKIVDMLHAVEMARVATQFAAWAAQVDDPSRQRAAAMAVAYATEMGTKVTGENIQLHGGMGFTWECDAHFLYKRAKQNAVMLGGASFQHKRLARMLIGSW
ncbi:MAG: acyl-CoA/acyl-ACP dehydrogenase [Actinobacteria bacterium]|nr:acyl-CoA/acyl-ACP dehydrogenase [Actinomycetota bacterium]